MAGSPPKAFTIQELALEIARARTKFPSNLDLGAALLEEVSEMFEMLADPNVHPSMVKAEALQVACVALRIFEEGDPAYAMWGRAMDRGDLTPELFARKAMAEAAIGLGNLAKVLLENMPLYELKTTTLDKIGREGEPEV